MFRLIEAEQAAFPIACMCERLSVSTSGYCAWRKRAPSARRRHSALDYLSPAEYEWRYYDATAAA